MKQLFTAALIVLAVSASAQSNSYKTLQDHFLGLPEVHQFKFRGFVARTVLALAASDQPVLRHSLDDIRYFRLIVIPKAEFRNQHLTVNGFTSVLAKDSFEELAHITDRRDNVRFYHRGDGNNKDTYFVLIDDDDEVVAIELKGYIDTDTVISELRRNRNI